MAVGDRRIRGLAARTRKDFARHAGVGMEASRVGRAGLR
jgi:hypothetical protein